MKKFILSTTLGFAMVVMLFSSGNVQSQAALPEEGYEPKLEPCSYPVVAGTLWVVKCRPMEYASCTVSSQIPCGEG
ncbi:hypothetical protein [Rhodonellum sp.]|uniref:hypothetical protein n=1 Tax=Rhodonellum sp. TaxID=2231180 RepID=UPI0027185963|nr:hypothetical protein [Rhodonellum sp.]MDO9554052.1 hypothetical protein [Rhodonellum sp.]